MNVENDKNNLILDTRTERGTSSIFKYINLINSVGFDKHCDQLTESQIKFIDLINNWFRERSNLVCVVTGGPGTGKTFTVVESLKYVDVNILKVAPTNKLARAIHGLTIHTGFKLGWEEGTYLHNVYELIQELEVNEEYVSSCLSSSSIISEVALNCPFQNIEIVVIDEIGMVPFWLTYQIIVYLFKKFNPLLIILMGDENQLRPVGCLYNIFDVQLPNIPMTLLNFNENNRFTPEYKVIIDNLKQNLNQNVVDCVRNHFPIYENMTESLFKKCNKILAYRNKTVDRYNDQYLDFIEGPNILLINVMYNKSLEGAIRVKRGCKVRSTTNADIQKGTDMIFLGYDNKIDIIFCELFDKKQVALSRNKFTGNFPIEVAFATTIHKFQGDTIDDYIIIDFDHNTDVHLIYTALSRVKSMDQIIGIINIM